MTRLFLFVLSFISVVSYAQADSTILVTLKLVKTQDAPAILPISLRFPEDCQLCKEIDDPAYARQNTREVILAMRLPASTPVALKVNTQSRFFRRVVLETFDLPFENNKEGLHFVVPPQIADRINSGEFQTHLYWPGVELRLEHADPKRRAGDYHSGEFPLIQRQAATNLEFGLLESIRRLGLDHYVDDQNLGRLFLMGFDTNYPHGHHDSPPHFHLALWLPNFHGGGSLIPHFYLTPRGLISHSIVMPYSWPLKSADYQPSDVFTATDMLARPVYTLTITPEGALDIARYDGMKCELTPIEDGFHKGVKISCQNYSSFSMKAVDDIDASEIREAIDGKTVNVFNYDPDTGALLQR